MTSRSNILLASLLSLIGVACAGRLAKVSEHPNNARLELSASPRLVTQQAEQRLAFTLCVKNVGSSTPFVYQEFETSVDIRATDLAGTVVEEQPVDERFINAVSLPLSAKKEHFLPLRPGTAYCSDLELFVNGWFQTPGDYLLNFEYRNFFGRAESLTLGLPVWSGPERPEAKIRVTIVP